MSDEPHIAGSDFQAPCAQHPFREVVQMFVGNRAAVVAFVILVTIMIHLESSFISNCMAMRTQTSMPHFKFEFLAMLLNFSTSTCATAKSMRLFSYDIIFIRVRQ